MKLKSKTSPEAEARSQEYLRIGNESIRKALEENRRLGLPNFITRDGQNIKVMPGGSEVVMELSSKRKRSHDDG